MTKINLSRHSKKIPISSHISAESNAPINNVKLCIISFGPKILENLDLCTCFMNLILPSLIGYYFSPKLMANIRDGRINVTNIEFDGRTLFLSFYTRKPFMTTAILRHCLIHACLKTKESLRVCVCVCRRIS